MEILVAIILLSILVLAHEFGHFFAARRAGILVEEFGIGLPPRLFGIKLGDTLYSVNALPFGGFVRIHGESGVESDELNRERAFFTKPISTRFAVLFAGVVMNFLLGIALFAVLFTAGATVAVSPENAAKLTDRRIEITGIAVNSPADTAGLETGVRIIGARVGGEVLFGNALSAEAFREFILQHAGEELSLTIARNNGESVVTARPRLEPPAGEGPLGIAMAEVGTIQYPWYQSIVEAIKTAFEIAGNTFAALYFLFRDLLVGRVAAPAIVGPVGIVQIAGEAAAVGILRLVHFAAILTINLAVLNILPIPALDGGRLVFLGIERARGKPIPRRIEQTFHAAGMAALIGLIILITIHDVRRL